MRFAEWCEKRRILHAGRDRIRNIGGAGWKDRNETHGEIDAHEKLVTRRWLVEDKIPIMDVQTIHVTVRATSPAHPEPTRLTMGTGNDPETLARMSKLGWERLAQLRAYLDGYELGYLASIPAIAPWEPGGAAAWINARASAPATPVCDRCNDTHEMDIGGMTVMCTGCPVPCQACRQRGRGPFCEDTPCKCDCHRKDLA